MAVARLEHGGEHGENGVPVIFTLLYPLRENFPFDQRKKEMERDDESLEFRIVIFLIEFRGARGGELSGQVSVNGQVDEKEEEEEEEEQETEEREERKTDGGRVCNSRAHRPIRFLRRGNRSQRRLLGYTVGAAKRS